MAGRVFPRPRRRRRLLWVLLAGFVLLAGVAVLFWWQPAEWRPPKPGWTGTEQAGWIAGIAGAGFGLASLTVALLDRRDARRQHRETTMPAGPPGDRGDGVVR